MCWALEFSNQPALIPGGRQIRRRAEKGAGSDPHSVPVHFAHLVCVEEGGGWSTTGGHPKRNQVATPVSAATSSALSLLEQINAHPGTWVQLSMWPMLDLEIRWSRTSRSICFPRGRPIAYGHSPTSAACQLPGPVSAVGL